MSLKVFVLTDDRAGNSNQAIALAKLLGFDYEEKRLEYNKLVAIPIFFKSGFELLNKNSAEHLMQDKPDVIISAGRRAASVALALKDRNRNTKIIQILGAQKSYKLFDLVILPEHDRKQFISYPDNVIFTPLAISCFSSYELGQESLKWQAVLAEYKQPYLAILIGGNYKKM
ncbi:putative nucleoside-diphosphate-sugar epimerase [endosymbiont of Acanthamoeba sp. UWC8]|uniref:ELM1/GtrOC1 family putative glycosyltransferase n=1 Tax=endosymbiont of Acanthamoeba sp. UWC8 TaxID=86106 RepID=UPI0004D15737|nr:ELM1/GtrOC1 family putative glycosyltransferase [endosymbiont of Acanthamoeba sp. UWC8]AIF80909.1 putative nucleoside-diphosphate-sugar epimerase [endosymbiont of Acanthamoeba sp. UWC8]